MPRVSRCGEPDGACRGRDDSVVWGQLEVHLCSQDTDSGSFALYGVVRCRAALLCFGGGYEHASCLRRVVGKYGGQNGIRMSTRGRGVSNLHSRPRPTVDARMAT